MSKPISFIFSNLINCIKMIARYDKQNKVLGLDFKQGYFLFRQECSVIILKVTHDEIVGGILCLTPTPLGICFKC